MSINLRYVEGTREKLWRIPRFHKIRSSSYTKNTLRKLHRKLKDRVATEDKNNTIYEFDCTNWEVVYFNESKRSLKLVFKHKRTVKNCDYEKNEIAKHCWKAVHNFRWDQKNVVYGESTLIPRRMKKTYIFRGVLIKFQTSLLNMAS